MTNRNKIWQSIELEIRSSKKKHPNWPDHIAAQAGIVCKEAGELMKSALKFKYEKGNNEKPIVEEMRKEAIQTAATAIRFLENLKS